MGIALGLSQPREFVWCQAESGHAALEAFGAKCCGTAGGEQACATDPRLPEVQSRGCTDVLVEAAARLPLGQKLSPHGAMAAPLLEDGRPGSNGSPHGAEDRGSEARAALSELVRSTVLRI